MEACVNEEIHIGKVNWQGGEDVVSSDHEIVAAGHICLDMIPMFPDLGVGLSDLLTPGKLVNVGPLTTSTGGPVSNTGLALHRLGFATRLMGKVGDDVVGRAILDIIQSYGPALAEGMIVTRESPSSYTVVISPPGVDRIFLHCPGANDTFGAEDVDYTKLMGARLFHFGYPPLMKRMYADGGRELSLLLQRVKSLGLTTSLDMARPDPNSEAGRADWPAILARALPYIDLFLPSFDEILFMLDRSRFEAMTNRDDDLNAQAELELLHGLAEELIGMGAAMVGFKLGTQGLYLLTTQNVARLEALGACVPAEPKKWAGQELLAPCFVVDVVGTTGSGDCTIAGFLGGLLKGFSLEAIMTSAVAVGACNVEQADALSGIPSWSIVEERIRTGWARRESAISSKGWQWESEKQIWRRS